MRTRRTLVVLGTLAGQPWAGMAWMHMQIAVGLKRLGHEVYYFEVTSAWPYDPRVQTAVCDSNYPVTYLARVAEGFGLGKCWAYRRSYADREWFGLGAQLAQDIMAGADAVLNISGATDLAAEDLKAGRLIYIGTDPVAHEVRFFQGDPATHARIAQHQDVVTYGENIGTSRCLLPPLPRLRATMRQPVLLDTWAAGPPSRDVFTTVCNWRQDGHDVEFGGQTYFWSKHHEFLKFVDLPQRVGRSIELALPWDGDGPARMQPAERTLLEEHGWRLVDAQPFSLDPWRYRDYVRASGGEFTVAKDQNVRLQSGWFSERSACYLAAGRPVITQDTGFSDVLPTGKGLFAFRTMDEILSAIEAIETDFEAHSRAAREIAEEYFAAEKVLARLLARLGL